MATTPSLLPREHGAYAQLAFPLITGLVLAGLSPTSLALGGAAVCLFLANEPLAILLGVRGRRLQDQAGGRARIRARTLLAAGCILGATGMILGWPEVWPWVLFPALAGLLLVPLALAGRQKSLSGEILALTAFSTLVLPLGVPSGVDPLRAALATGVWWISFALGTLEVHAIKARIKVTARHRWTIWGAPVAAGTTMTGALWLALGQAGPVLQEWASGSGDAGMGLADPSWVSELVRLLPPNGAALLPPAVAIFLLSLLREHPRHLKRVGWTLVAVNVLTLVLLLQE
jgi:hypothetical protein